MVERAKQLRNPAMTEDLVRAAAAESDRKGALGALRMLEVEGIVHALSGGRRQLVWHPGPRPKGTPHGRMIDRSRYELLHYLLHSSGGWISTDRLIVDAGFDADLLTVARRPARRRDQDLPLTYLADQGKSARKYVLGALKALFWLERIAWRNYSRQAIEWRWVGSVQQSRDRPVVEQKRVSDPYLLQEDQGSREERLRERVLEREIEHEDRRQRWIETHHPKKAADYAYERWRREKELEEARKATLREAASWGWDGKRNDSAS